MAVPVLRGPFLFSHLQHAVDHFAGDAKVICRVYHFLQNDLYQTITGLIREREKKAGIPEA